MLISRERVTARMLVSLYATPKLKNVDFKARKDKILISR